MFRSILVILLLMVATPAHADWFHILVGYKCDTENNAVVLTYRGAYNEDGERMIKNKGPQEWDPWSLTKTDGRGIFSRRKTVGGECQLKDGSYKIEIGPQPMNTNINGRCGAAMTAWAEVWQGLKVILARQNFEVYCLGDHPVTTEILIRSGGREIVMKKVPSAEFYGWSH